jgi:hypothetical protein
MEIKLNKPVVIFIIYIIGWSQCIRIIVCNKITIQISENMHEIKVPVRPRTGDKTNDHAGPSEDTSEISSAVHPTANKTGSITDCC